jgi:putative heme-binding domain-containing protein
LLSDVQTDPHFRNEVSRIAGEFPSSVVNGIFKEVKNAPPDLQTNMAVALAATTEGKRILFERVQRKEMFPRTLLEPRVRERILLNISPAQKKQFEDLTKDVSPVDQAKQELIDTRFQQFEVVMQSSRKPSVDSGIIVFTSKCATCHSINAEGGDIGPNLDGVAQWGAKALTEKIIDPNRNISENFRMYTIRLKDGKVSSGLYRREEGAVIIFADLTGKEFSIPKADIAEQTPSKLTLMPDNFGQTISQQEFDALVHFLLNPKNVKK